MKNTFNSIAIGLAVVAGMLCASTVVQAQAQSGPSSPYLVTGPETAVSELPPIKGRWYNSTGNASNTFKVENGVLSMWSGRKCGEAKMTVEKVFQDDTKMTIEAGQPTDVINCGIDNGITFVFDKKDKKGLYLIRASKADRSIQHYGKIEIE